MSFLDIKDPKKRDAIVADYLATIRRIQQRNLIEKAQDLIRKEDLQKMFSPVVKSTEESTKAITKELVPMREEIKNLNENVLHQKQQQQKKKKTQVVVPDDNVNIVERYRTTYDESKIDSYFSIQPTAVKHQYVMGDTNVLVDRQANIFVDGVKYDHSPGLWQLIMMKSPIVGSYTDGDLVTYRRLVHQTNVMASPRNVIPGQSRPKSTYKWKHILEPFQHRTSSIADDDRNADVESAGSGIQFLPKDIKGLTTKLNLLLGEYAAGNRTSTRNEIVSILDELLRRKKISRKEYTDINSYLSKCL